MDIPIDTDNKDVSSVGRSALFVTTVPVTLFAFLTPFADHFREQGWRVDALARDITGEPPTTSFDAARGRELALHFDNLYSADWTREASSLIHTHAIAKHVRRLVLDNGYDIVHVHTPIAAFVTRYALRNVPDERRPAVIYTAHGFHFYRGQSPLPHELFKTMEQMAARWTDYLVTINDEDYQAATAFGTIDPARVRKSNGIGVDTDFYSPFRILEDRKAQLRLELGVGEHDPLITMVAELGEVKRHGLALEALRHLITTNKDTLLAHTKLLLIGEGALEQDIKAEVNKIGLGSHVIFGGFRDDVADILCASDLTILTSRREGLPRSILESLACGTPAIGTATRGITDAIGDPRLISGYASAEELGDIAARVLSDPAYHEELSERARSRALSLFSLDSIISFYDALYTEALS